MYERIKKIVKLTPETMDLAYEYINQFHPDSMAETDEVIPTMTGLATYIGVSYRTLSNWVGRHDFELHDEFVDLRDLLKDIYKTKLINRGLDRGYDSQIVKLLLGQEGIVDKSAVDTTSSDGSMSPMVIDKDVVNSLAEKLTD